MRRADERACFGRALATGARAYSTVLAHFLSADPAVASAYDPQSWHAYSYVRNNPLRFVDPTGSKPIDMPGEPNRSRHRPTPSGPTDKQWAESKSIEVHRDTGCDWNCQQLTALAAAGLTYEQWQRVGAVTYAAQQSASFAAAQAPYDWVTETATSPVGVPSEPSSRVHLADLEPGLIMI